MEVDEYYLHGLSVVVVGVFLIYYGQVAAFLVGLLFSFVKNGLLPA